MIKKLIGEALNANGASMLDDFGLSSDKQDKALGLAKDSVLGGLTQSFQSGNIGVLQEPFQKVLPTRWFNPLCLRMVPNSYQN